MKARVFRASLRTFFRHLYHELAWIYDSFARAVSLGRWFRWIDVIVPLLRGPRILELGHGTGYLLARLGTSKDFTVVGLDESRQMARLARRRALKAGASRPNLVRGLAHELPIANATMDTIVATFPTEFIFEPQMRAQLKAVLRPGGQLVVLPAAWIVGQRLPEQFAAWLFAVTGQVPPHPEERLAEMLATPLAQEGFEVSIRKVEIAESVAMVLVATWPAGAPTIAAA